MSYIRSKTNSALVQNMKKKSPLDSKKYTKNLVGIWLHFIWRVLKMKHRTHCMVWKHLLLFNLFLYYNRIFYYKKWSISLANRIKKKHRTRKYSLVLNIYFKWCMLLCRNILQNFYVVACSLATFCDVHFYGFVIYGTWNMVFYFFGACSVFEMV